MHRRILICLVFWGISFADATAQDTLTVMSYNIYHGENAYREGESCLGDIADIILKVYPDFVALQEVDEFTGRSAVLNKGTPFSIIDSLAKLTKMEGYFGKTINFDDGDYGIAILARRPLNVKKMMLPNPKDGEKRSVLLVESRINSDMILRFASTHLDHQYIENRIDQVEKINNYFSGIDQPTILAGDFNLTPDSKSYANIDQQWIDAAKRAREHTSSTYPSIQPRKRIDYLFLSRRNTWDVLDFRTIKSGCSDHLPVIAKVVIHSN